MRLSRIIAVLAVLLIAALVSAAVAASATKIGVRKTSKGFRWTQSTLTIKKGTKVVWRWRGKALHNVTGRGFHSRTAKRLRYAHRFRRKGTFTVFCTIHVSQGQRMTIRVR